MNEITEFKKQIISLRGQLKISKKTETELLDSLNKIDLAINYTRCCEPLPNSKEPICFIIKQIEENANRIIEEVKQVNKFTVNKKNLRINDNVVV